MSDLAAGAIAFAIFALTVIAWMTHIIWCFTTAAWGFLLAGAIFFPIGIVHGVWLWF